MPPAFWYVVCMPRDRTSSPASVADSNDTICQPPLYPVTVGSTASPSTHVRRYFAKIGVAGFW